MSHRVVIIDAVKTLFTEPEVREQLTNTQLARVDHVCTHTDISDNDFRFLMRRLSQAYCADD